MFLKNYSSNFALSRQTCRKRVRACIRKGGYHFQSWLLICRDWRRPRKTSDCCILTKITEVLICVKQEYWLLHYIIVSSFSCCLKYCERLDFLTMHYVGSDVVFLKWHCFITGTANTSWASCKTVGQSSGCITNSDSGASTTQVP